MKRKCRQADHRNRKAPTEILDEALREQEASAPEQEPELPPMDPNAPVQDQALRQAIEDPLEYDKEHLSELVAEWANVDQVDCIVDKQGAIYDGRDWLDEQRLAEFYGWFEETRSRPGPPRR